ncbi:MAG: VTT domain-containing protein, partial [Clostridia bacterium]|nr:VTT domain-containing protein [Clostridia bacterium]
TLRNIIIKSGNFSIIVYVIIMIVILTCFCFVPYLNVTLTVLGIVLFGAKLAFIANIIAVFFSTTILFFIGDKLGEKFARKLVGEKSFNEAQNLIDRKSKLWLPILFVLPCIPDEAICLVAGMTKIKYWYLLLVSLLYHTVEIGVCCFIGSGLIPWSSLTLFDWIVFINLVLIDIYLLLKFEKYLEKRIK